MTPKQRYFKLIAETTIKSFAKRQIEAFYCEDKESAVQKALELMPQGSSIGWGGSQTLGQLGLMDRIAQGGYTLYDRLSAKTPEAVREMKRDLFTCDYFLMSTNAFTPDGHLVNMDGTGNRVAYLCYGPQNVLVFAGMNKLAPDLESAITRVRQYAAPVNNVRLDTGMPCTHNGKCSDCTHEKTVCCQLVITRFSAAPGRIKVILVGDELGF